MIQTRTRRAFFLVALSALILSCRIVWTNPPMPTPVPTASPTPTLTPTPTETPTPVPTDTPSPTATLIPTQSVSSLLDALKQVAQGSGAPEAAVYQRNQSGMHPIFILAPDDEVESWNSDLPDGWRPASLSQVELVAKIKYIEVKLNQTRYRHPGESGWIYVTRIRIDTVVTLYEAKTGKEIETKTFQGVEPMGFPPYLPGGTMNLYGDKVSHETVQDWLEDFVVK